MYIYIYIKDYRGMYVFCIHIVISHHDIWISTKIKTIRTTVVFPPVAPTYHVFPSLESEIAGTSEGNI